MSLLLCGILTGCVLPVNAVENTVPQEEETELDNSTEEKSVLDGEAEPNIAVVQNEIVDESRSNPFSNLCRK